jgi:hypothetical protein
MSMEERIDARVALILRNRIETTDSGDSNESEKDLCDIMGGRIPREIWQQRNLKPGYTLLSPVGRFSVDSLDHLLLQRSKSIQGVEGGLNIFPFRKLLEIWLKENLTELKHNYLQAGGGVSDIEQHFSVEDGCNYLHLEIATSSKDSLIRWLDHKSLGSCEVMCRISIEYR